MIYGNECLWHSLLKGAGVRTGGAFFTGVPVGAWLGAVTLATDALPPTTAQEPTAGHTGVCACGAVTIISRPVGFTDTITAITLPVPCGIIDRRERVK